MFNVRPSVLAGLIQLCVNEAGEAVALEEFEPNREAWSFAKALPSIPENYRCCGCAQAFQQHPGPAVQCPRCGHIYVTVRGNT